jgi:hypothetical protein
VPLNATVPLNAINPIKKLQIPRFRFTENLLQKVLYLWR